MVRLRAPARRGVILVDVVVGTVILAIALGVMLSLAARALGLQSDGRHLETVADLLDERLQLVLARGPDEYAQRFETSGVCDPPFEAYAWELEFEGGAAGDPYRVRATIRWREGFRDRSASLETLIAPRLGDDPDPERRPPETETRP